MPTAISSIKSFAEIKRGVNHFEERLHWKKWNNCSLPKLENCTTEL